MFANADMAQLVERVLGKDEVTGSTPVISSKKTPKLGFEFRSFFYSLFRMASLPSFERNKCMPNAQLKPVTANTLNLSTTPK